ncbi:MAG: GNAT family N-acetyltransferase [Oscillospiraceae bacterium]
MDMFILEAKEADLPACARVIVDANNPICEAYGFQKNQDSQAAEERLKDELFSGGHVFVGLSGKEIVATFTVNNIAQEKRTFEISKIAVRPELQKQGLGQKLLDYALLFISKQGGQCAYCAFPEANTAVMNWLLKNGFFVDGYFESGSASCPICILQKSVTPEEGCGGESCGSCDSCE